MRDLFVALFVLGALPVSFKRPVVGILVFSMLAYGRIQDLTWGFARYERWSLYVALTMLAGWFFQRERHGPIWTVRTGILLFLPIWMFIGLVVSIGPKAFVYTDFIEYVKIIFIALFTTAVVRRREHLRVLMWVIGGVFAFFGVKNGVATLLSGGSLYIIRGPGGMLVDNNDFALALAMSVPILVGLATSEVNEYYRKWIRVSIPFAVLSILATRSRGGFLSLGLATFILIWRSKNRIAGIALMGMAGAVGLLFLPSSMFDRLSTLQNVEEDGSAMGRLAAWKIAWKMIVDQPALGVGFNQFQHHYLDYGSRVGDRADGSRVAHNGYLQIWSECGTPAFLAYMSLLVLSILAVQRIRREANRLYDRSWILSYCTAFEGALLTFMLGSIFLNRAHFDLTYHYFAIIIAFERVARAEMADPLSIAAPRRKGIGGRLTRFQGFGFGRTPGQSRKFRHTDLNRSVGRSFGRSTSGASGSGLAAPEREL